MTVIGGKTLKGRLSDNNDSLVITLILDPGQINDTTASIDLRLGSIFLSLERGRTPLVDWSKAESADLFAAQFQSTYVPLGGTYVIHPNQFVLASTLEFVSLPQDVMAYVVTRSSWGRTGLVVATAIGIQPNYRGVITLELRNLGEIPVVLRPGTSVLQLFLHDVAGASAGEGGTYVGSIQTMPPSPQSEPALDLLADYAHHPLPGRSARDV